MNGRRELLLGLGLAIWGLACGGPSPGEARSGADAAAPANEAAPPKPKDAKEIAIRLADGRVGATLYMDRVRGHALGPKLLGFGPVKELLEGTSVDPLVDLERVFATGPSVTKGRGVLFAEHNIAPERIPQVLEDLMKKSDPRGEPLPGSPHPAVLVRREGFVGAVAFVPPRYLVALPEDQIQELRAFEKTGGIADPTGPEAMHLFAKDPAETLSARGVPRVPDSISSAQARVELTSDGGLLVSATGESSSPEQAERDARTLTKRIDDRTSVRLGIIKIRAFKSVEFESRGSQVVSSVRLSRGEIEQLLSLAARFLPR